MGSTKEPDAPSTAPTPQDPYVFRALFESVPGRYLVLTPGEYRIVAVSDAYLEAVRSSREELVGQRVFDVFPLDHPADPEARGAHTLKASLERIKEGNTTDVVPLQKYPIARPESQGGGYEDRFWSVVNAPVAGPDGELAYIIHRAEDVTAFVKQRRKESKPAIPDALGSPVQRMEADVVLKALELERLNRERDADADRFREIFHGAAVGIAIATPEGRFLQANPAFCRMVGYGEEELRNMDFPSLTHPDDRPANLRLVRELLEGERPSFVMEKRYVAKNEEIVWSRVSVSILRSRQGRPTRLAAVSEDISERKRVEAEAERLADRLAATLESITDAFLTLDREWRFTYMNREAENLMDRDRADLLGKVVWDEFPEAVGSTFQRQYERALRIGQSVQFEEFYPPLDTWVSVHAYPSDEGLAVYLQDVTEARQARQALEESEARYRTLIDASPDAIWVVCDGKLVMANPAAAELLGAESADELVGRPLVDIVHPDYRRVVRRRLEAIDEGRQVPLMEQKALRLDGTEVDVEVVSAPLTWKGGPAVQLIVRDITDKKQLQAQFLRAQRVESIGTLAGGIAHDLNNVLAPILMSIGLLRLTDDDAERMEILSSVESAANRGADLVRQVLTFAKGAEGDPVKVSPEDVIADIETMVRETFPRSVRFEARVDPDIWPVVADPTQLHQVLLNLCVNARDAMPAGGTLRVSAKNTVVDEHYTHMGGQGAPGPHVVFTVRDTGEGIPEQIRDRIFDPFFTTKEVGRGTGLGLSTVLAIARSHRGFVNVYSQSGEGSTFRVYLPAEPELAARGWSHPPVDSEDLPRGDGERVLVVDDEAPIRSITRRTLETFGYRVATAVDGQEAVAYFEEHGDEVDVVLTDVNMPGLDGPATAKILRELDPAVRIVAVSGLGASGGFGGAFGPRVQHFLAKPYTTQELLQVLADVLEGGAGQG